MAIGKKTGGGSRKGRPNKVTAEREKEIQASGLTPLDYMLSALRNPATDQARRDWAAQTAAPYCHARLSQIDANHSGSLDLRGWLQKLGEDE